MQKFKIEYEEVYNQTAQLKTHIDDLLLQINSEYSRIQSILDEVDSKTNASLKEGVEVHRQKSIKAANIMSKLLSFMANSSKQVEIHDARMSNIISNNGGKK
ncbi:MAG: hypothetical protein LBL82_01605 [Oscillospiraceae bacterium]|jgi:hypothetical protein|nr:hypothetical protein [Oscillospiraceae bacterium]